MCLNQNTPYYITHFHITLTHCFSQYSVVTSDVIIIISHVWITLGVCRFTREVVQKRRALISQQRMTETQTDFNTKSQRRKDFVDIILLTKVEEKKNEA